MERLKCGPICEHLLCHFGLQHFFTSTLRVVLVTTSSCFVFTASTFAPIGTATSPTLHFCRTTICRALCLPPVLCYRNCYFTNAAFLPHHHLKGTGGVAVSHHHIMENKLATEPPIIMKHHLFVAQVHKKKKKQ